MNQNYMGCPFRFSVHLLPLFDSRVKLSTPLCILHTDQTPQSDIPTAMLFVKGKKDESYLV